MPSVWERVISELSGGTLRSRKDSRGVPQMDRALKRTCAILVVLLTLPVHARAQDPPDTLSGVVYDEITGTPVSGAIIALIEFDGGGTAATVFADQGGRFAVQLTPGHYWITASQQGFASAPPREILWDQDSESVAGLLLNLRTLDQEVLSVRSRAGANVDGASVLGRIMDRESGQPVFDADVELGSSGLRTSTDRNGMFSFPDVPPGAEVMRIRHLAYEEQTRGLELESGKAYEVNGRISPDPIEVEGIEVTATSRTWFRRMDSLRGRMERGRRSDFVLAIDFERRGYPPLANALQEVPGVEVSGSGVRRRITIPRCASPANAGEPVIYLDGIKVHRPGSGNPMYVLWEVSSLDLEAIEVYKGPASVPAEFSGSDAACGAIVIWTKRGG